MRVGQCAAASRGPSGRTGREGVNGSPLTPPTPSTNPPALIPEVERTKQEQFPYPIQGGAGRPTSGLCELIAARDMNSDVIGIGMAMIAV